MSDIVQPIVLALIQAITEFLPISSSAHLLLPNLLLGWQDQGLAFDVAVHFGSLLAVIAYLRSELLDIILPWTKTNASSSQRRQAYFLVVATVPVVVAGFALQHWVESLRAVAVIAGTTFVFALPLWWADRRSGERTLADMEWRDVYWIGMAQILALVPGVSRSGITMTAGLFLGLDRVSASKFSFLLAIPVITAATVLKGQDLFHASTAPINWWVTLCAVAISAIVSFVTIDGFIRLVRRVGMLPFVVYRLFLGGYLILWLS